MKSKNEFGGGRSLGVIPVRGFLSIGVGFTWTVAHFTASGGVQTGGRQSCVPSLTELLKLGFVTRSAAVRAGVSSIRYRHRRNRDRRGLCCSWTRLSNAANTGEQK